MKAFLPICLALVVGCASHLPEKPVATIALLSDPHTMVGKNGQDGIYEQHFETAIAQVNKAKVDFVLIAGDLSNGGQPDQWREFSSRTKKFAAPVFYVPGNHDVGHKFNSGKPNGTITVERLKMYEDMMGPSFFAKDQHGIRVIGVDASLFGSGFEREHEQWKFLETELAKRNDRPKIVFMHYPPFVAKPTESGGGYWNIEPEPRERLLRLCKSADVTAILSGHLHRPLMHQYEGMLLLTTPPVSFGIPRNANLEGWTLVRIWKNSPPTFEFRKLDENVRASRP